MLKVDNLTCGYANKPILKDISFELDEIILRGSAVLVRY